MARRCVAVLVLSIAALCIGFMAVTAQNLDFHAFYCAGSVAHHGENPYRTEPLRSCEQHADSLFARSMHGAALPAPFPGYVIWFLQGVSLLPFAIAAKLWTFVLIAAILAGGAILVRMTGVHPAFAAAALCLSIGIPSLGFGEVLPLFFCALCLSMWYAAKENWTLSAFFAGATLVEPHLGLPVCVALFAWRRQTRFALLTVAVFALAASLSALPVSQNIEYLTKVLPLHALSELGSDRQLSLSVILHAFGASNETAVRAGFLSYLVTGSVGVLFSGRIARRLGSDAYLVAVPAATSVIGGSFIHVTQIAAAIPLALLLLRALPERRAVILTCVVALAVPWLLIGQPILIALAVIFASYLAWEGTQYTAGAAIVTAMAVFCILSVFYVVAAAHTPMPGGGSVTIPAEYAEASWAHVNRVLWSTGNAVSWALRAPTWIALLMLAASALSAVPLHFARARDASKLPVTI